MRTVTPAAGLFLAAALFASLAQQSEVRRTELQRHDLIAPELEGVQARIEFPSGAEFGDHWHPGEEFVYVLEGTLEYKLAGLPAVTLKAGDTLLIPAGTIHAARNVGTDHGVELATYIVEKGKPLLVMTK